MSSVVLSTSAALGRPFVFDAEPEPEAGMPTPGYVGTAAACPERSRRGCPVERSSTARREHILQSTSKNQPSKIPPASVIPASQLQLRPAPEMAPSGIPAIDALTGGLPRGCLTEICGPASSGRTTLLLAALAAATRRGEFCVVVDASDALDPHSAAAAGVELDRLLWIRCGDDQNSPAPQNGWADSKKNVRKNNDWKENDLQKNASRQSERRLEQVLRATDLLLESGGFGLIVLDLGDLPTQAARRIPLTTWFRFRRAVENKPTILLAIEQQAIAGSCSSLLLQLGASNPMFPADESAAKRRKNAAHGASRGLAGGEEQAPEERKKINASSDFHSPSHAQLLTGMDVTAELIRSRLDRKPARSATFATKTAWAG